MDDKRSNDVTITDVTLREYGQNVPSRYLTIFTPETRIKLILKIIDIGFKDIEVFSCVHPRIAPAMRFETLKKIAASVGRVEGVNIITLVPNRTGYQHFNDMELGPEGLNHTLGIFFSAVEEHNIENTGRSIKDTLNAYFPILHDARLKGIRVIGCISAALGYAPPGKGLIKTDVIEINDFIDRLIDLGVSEITFSDLQGVANEKETGRFFETLLQKRNTRDLRRFGFHPHHRTAERAIANSMAAYKTGIRRFDSSLGGTGGCVTGAPGNQPTAKLIHCFHQLGINTGLSLEKTLCLTDWVRANVYSKIPLPFQ